MKTLRTLFLVELADRYDAEKQLIQAMPKIAEAASSPQLKKLIQARLSQVESQVKKIERIFEAFDEKPTAKRCDGTNGIIKEATGFATAFKGSPAINAALVSVAQKMVHYEIASYGCLHEWASVLDNAEAENIIKVILDDANQANKSLIDFARSHSNEEAMARGASGDSEKNGNRSAAAPV